jgi:hypothetical protein
VLEFDMVHLVASSCHHKESKPEKRKQSAAPFAQLRGKNLPHLSHSSEERNASQISQSVASG